MVYGRSGLFHRTLWANYESVVIRDGFLRLVPSLSTAAELERKFRRLSKLTKLIIAASTFLSLNHTVGTIQSESIHVKYTKFDLVRFFLFFQTSCFRTGGAGFNYNCSRKAWFTDAKTFRQVTLVVY